LIAALLLAAQGLAPEAAADTFLSACAAGLRDPSAFAASAARLNLVRVEERGRGALFRAGNVELLYEQGAHCALRALIAGDARPVIERVSTSLGLAPPQPIAMHPPGWTRYRWPVADGPAARFYLAAQTMMDHEGAVSLDLSIHAGPAR
jgi:hypothetical protein